MSLLSIEFAIFTAVCFLLYYILPLKARWLVLLIVSLFFYAGYGLRQFVVLLLTALIAYTAARLIEHIYAASDTAKADTAEAKQYLLSADKESSAFPELSSAKADGGSAAHKDSLVKAKADTAAGGNNLTAKKNTAAAVDARRNAKAVLIISIALVLAELVLVKTGHDIFGSLWSRFINGEADASLIIVPLGLSYYTFSIVGYMADVYWKRDKAEHNFLRFLLYMIYFPQIIEGPIPRHKKLQAQLNEGHRFDYRQFCFGLQRVVWGAFKKLVIADRLSVAVGTIAGNYSAYSGEYFVLYMVMTAVMLYADFSGCIDMVIGISECFGIRLDENFRQPFASRSAAEFWRRWHITLGAWFKDYVFMPLAVNPKLIALSKAMKKIFGAKFAKTIMTIIPLAVVWLLTGLWHGTGIDYIVWGCYWGLLIIISTVFAQQFKKLDKLLHIDTDSWWWKCFQQLRTFVIFCWARLLTAPGDIHISWFMFKSMLRDYNPWIFTDQSMYSLGLDRADVWLVLAAILIMGAVGHMHEKGIHIRENIAAVPLPIRWCIYYIAIFAVIIFGYYGPGYNASAFIYMQF